MKDASEEVTKTVTETSKESNKALMNLNDKLLEVRIDTGILASLLLSPFSRITNPEISSQIKLVTVPQSNRVNGFLIK